jgi:hypothetical protein
MYFVQTTFLAAAAAISIPIIVHLMFRSQARKVNLGTLRFLRQVLERNAQRQRIMRWLLLALRMAACALLAVLFARPYFLEAAASGDKRLIMLLIDRSASMDLKGDQGRLLDQAMDEAKRIVESAPAKTQVELAFFDHTVRPQTSGAQAGDASEKQGTVGDVLKALEGVDGEASYGATNYGAALNWARDLSIRTRAAKQELHLFTDMQQSGMDWSEVEPMPEHVQVHLHDLGRAVVNNVAVTEARPIRAVIRPGESTTVQATILNGGAFPLADLPVVLKLESPRGKLNLRERVRVEPGSTASAKFDLPAVEAGLWTGQVSIETDDDLQFDNSRQLAILSTPPSRVLLVDGDPKRSVLLSETYFLGTALRLAGPEEAYADAPFEADSVAVAEEDSFPSTSGYRVIVLANVKRVTAADASRLKQFVEEGGSLVVFGGENVAAAGYETMKTAGLVPGTLVGPQHVVDLPFRIDQWDQKSSLLKPFVDPQHGDIRRLTFRGYTRIVVPDAAAPTADATPSADAPRVLATFRGGDPALIEMRPGKGTCLWFTSSCDRGWSEWTSTKLYVPLIHQIIGHGLGLNDGGPIRPVSIEANALLTDAERPQVAPHDNYWNVVNVSPRESETDRCTLEEFYERFQLTPASESGEEPVKVAAITHASDLRNDEQSHWAGVVLVALLLMEAFVANRTVS